MKAIGGDVGVAGLFALGAYLTSDDGPLKDASPNTKRLLNAVFAAPVGYRILGPGLRDDLPNLKNLKQVWHDEKVPDFLMTALSSTIGVLGIGMNDRTMMQSAAMLAVLFSMAGRLEDGVMEKSAEGIDALEKIVPATAKRRTDNGTLETIETHAIKEGDHLVVAAGETVPVDGHLVEMTGGGKNSAIGAVAMPKALNGENIIAPLQKGEPVPQGAVAHESHFVVKASGTAAESTILKNVQFLREAEESAPAHAIHSIKNTVNKAYIPLMVAAVAAQFGLSYYLDDKKHKLKDKMMRKAAGTDKDGKAPEGESEYLQKHGVKHKLNTSVKRSAELAIKMAPCAITASMLLMPFAKNRLAAHHGILVREEAALEKAHSITHVLTDIRGTLTKGVAEFGGLHEWVEGGFKQLPEKLENTMLGLIGRAQAESTHPLAKTLRTEASKRGVAMNISAADKVASHPGMGVAAELEHGAHITIGSSKLFEHQKVALPKGLVEAAEAQHGDVSYIRYHDPQTQRTHFGIAAFDDPLREGVVDAVHTLRKQGKKVVLVTGMPETAAQKIVKQLEQKPVPENPLELRAGRIHLGEKGKPGKDDVVREFIRPDKHVIATIGDGENDAPFMAMMKEHGGLSFAIGSTGAGATKDVASMVIDGIHQLPDLMSLSRNISRAMMINVSAAAAWMAALIGSHILGKEMKTEHASIAHEAPTFLMVIASVMESIHLTKKLPNIGKALH